MTESRGLATAEAHIRAEAHQRTVACMRGHRAFWWVRQRNCNHSAFNGGHRTTSDYSEVVCGAPGCGRVWRTKAAYVRDLP